MGIRNGRPGAHAGGGRVIHLDAQSLQPKGPEIPPEMFLIREVNQFKRQVDAEEKEARELLEQLDARRSVVDQEQLRELERYHARCTAVQAELATYHLGALAKVTPKVGDDIENSLAKLRKLFTTEKADELEEKKDENHG